MWYPVSEEPPQNISVQIGSNVTLNCTFDFLGNCSWEHYRDTHGYPVTIKTANNKTICSLEIINVTPNDVGVWRCNVDSRIYSLGTYLWVTTEMGKFQTLITYTYSTAMSSKICYCMNPLSKFFWSRDPPLMFFNYPGPERYIHERIGEENNLTANTDLDLALMFFLLHIVVQVLKWTDTKFYLFKVYFKGTI